MNPTCTLDPVTETPLHALLEGARRGDREALEELFGRLYPRVQRMVHGHLARDMRQGRPWLAARFSTGDVVQEVFRSVLQDLDAFSGSGEEALIGYIAMVVRNRLIDAIRFHEASRRDGRRGGSETAVWREPGQDEGPAAAAATAEEVRRLHEALEEFPERERLLLRARYEGTRSLRELAEQLGYSSESAARRAFHAAQARLALRLTTPGQGEGEA
jgi:RNA polymerase sigma factor (sigma-70 family)